MDDFGSGPEHAKANTEILEHKQKRVVNLNYALKTRRKKDHLALQGIYILFIQ